MKKKKILLLGKSGMLAQALMRVARQENYEVIPISKSTGFDLTQVKSSQEFGEIFDRFETDLVFNATGITNLLHCEKYPEQAWMLHARLPALIANWSNRSQAPWIHVSTDHYFNNIENITHSESDKLLPQNEYAASKLAGEYLALTSAKALVLRTNIIGIRGWSGQLNFAEWAMERLSNPDLFEGFIDTWASSIEVGQFAQLALKMIETGATGLMNLGCSESLSKAEWIEKIAIKAGKSSCHMKKIKTPTSPYDSLKRANAMGLDCAKSEKHLSSLGLRLPNSDEVVDALIQSFRGSV